MNGIDISWYLILSMCIGVALVLYVIIKIIMNIKRNAKQNVNTKKEGSASAAQNTGDNNTTQATTIAVHGNGNQINLPREVKASQEGREGMEQEKNDYLSANILFIDDDPEYKIDNILTKMGFRHIVKIADVTSVELTEIKQAEILFVDYNNVGKEVFGEKEGLGAALAIKKRYPSKKVVMNSAYPHMYDSDLKYLDGLISKNSAPEQYRATIEDLYKA